MAKEDEITVSRLRALKAHVGLLEKAVEAGNAVKAETHVGKMDILARRNGIFARTFVNDRATWPDLLSRARELYRQEKQFADRGEP